MNLATYVARRLALMVLVVFGVLVITFVVSHVVPADPGGALLGGLDPPCHFVRRTDGRHLRREAQRASGPWGAAVLDHRRLDAGLLDRVDPDAVPVPPPRVAAGPGPARFRGPS